MHTNCDLRRDLACVTSSLSTGEANMGPPNKYAPSCTFPYGPVFVLLYSPATPRIDPALIHCMI